MNADIVKVGIIGCGAFSESQHFPNCKNNPRVEIRALCDLRTERMDYLEKKFDLDNVFKTTDFEELINRPEIDMVIVATDHNAHLEIVEKASRRGKHILIEKPMSIDYIESIKILRAVKESGIKFCVDYNRPFSPSMVDLKKELIKHNHNPIHSPWRSKRDAKLNHLHEEDATNLVITINDEIDSYRPVHLDPIKGGGLIIGESCHFLDLACWLIDKKPIRIYATGSTRLSHAIVLNFEDGSIATIHFSSCGTFDYPKERYELTNKGALFLNEFFVEVNVYGRGEKINKTYSLQNDPLADEVPGEGFQNYLNKVNLVQNRFKETGNFTYLMPDKGHRNLLNEFVTSILENKPSPVDAERGLRATYLSNKAIESIKTGLPVPICQEDIDVYVDV
ncbi:MAG: Gfo/Idh/MocA family oxidoreductase [Caldicoprobacterales bacterium]|mgnify:CR=1 FL=1|jgi:predicted dehydrogenase